MLKKNLVCLLFLIAVFLVCTSAVFAQCGCPKADITDYNGLYVIKIPYGRVHMVKPYITKFLRPNREIFNETNAELVINAGYFDPKNKKTSSYVVIDGKTVLDPTTNDSLMNNLSLSPYLPDILDRTEFRVLDCNGKTKFDIARHTEPASPDAYHTLTPSCRIVHSIQAGPMLYPNLTLEKEYFVSYRDGKLDRDSISAMKKCARTAIGLRNNDIYIIIATVSHRMTLPEMAEFCKKLGLEKAMNFDGGGSTSVNYKGTNNPKYKDWEIISDKDASARKLKSFLVID